MNLSVCLHRTRYPSIYCPVEGSASWIAPRSMGIFSDIAGSSAAAHRVVVSMVSWTNRLEAKLPRPDRLTSHLRRPKPTCQALPSRDASCRRSHGHPIVHFTPLSPLSPSHGKGVARKGNLPPNIHARRGACAITTSRGSGPLVPCIQSYFPSSSFCFCPGCRHTEGKGRSSSEHVLLPLPSTYLALLARSRKGNYMAGHLVYCSSSTA